MNTARLTGLSVALALALSGTAFAQANVDAINNSNLATTGNHQDAGVLSLDQETSLRSAFGDITIDPAIDTDLDITIGSSVPDTIDLEPVPQGVVDFSADYTGYRYFRLPDGRLVLVEPDSPNIAVILP